MLKPNQYPTNKGCMEAREKKVQVNYMYGDNIHCAYGLLSKVPRVMFHEETEAVPVEYVFIMLNSFESHQLFVDFVGMNVMHGATSKFMSRVFRDPKKDTHSYKIADFLYLYVPRSEYIVEHLDQVQKGFRIFAQLMIFFIPSFCILFFNSDYKKYGVYWMQFGILFDMASNVTWSIVEMFFVLELVTPVYVILIFTILFAASQSDVYYTNLIKAWKVWVIADYVLMALLMQDKGSFLFCCVNVGLFWAVVQFIRRASPGIQTKEYYISFAISLSMLNQLGNIWYHTTSLNRLLYLVDGLKIHDLKPGFYYFGFGIIFTLLALSRIFMNENLSWNVQARLRVSNQDDDANVTIDLNKAYGGTTREMTLTKKMISGLDETSKSQVYEKEEI